MKSEIGSVADASLVGGQTEKQRAGGIAPAVELNQRARAAIAFSLHGKRKNVATTVI